MTIVPDERADGIDVSSWQPDIIWHDVPDEVIFVISKATEGYGYSDPEYVKNILANAGKRMRGPYHFFRPSLSWKLQAEYFAKVILANYTELPPVVDFEVTDGMLPLDRIIDWLVLFCDYVEQLTGKRIMLYTGTWFLQQFSASQLARLKKYLLWIAWWPFDQKNKAEFLLNFANYKMQVKSMNPSIPYPWGANEWVIWQWASVGNYKGISSPYDRTYLYNVDCNVSRLTTKQMADAYGFVLPGTVTVPTYTDAQKLEILWAYCLSIGMDPIKFSKV